MRKLICTILFGFVLSLAPLAQGADASGSHPTPTVQASSPAGSHTKATHKKKHHHKKKGNITAPKAAVTTEAVPASPAR